MSHTSHTSFPGRCDLGTISLRLSGGAGRPLRLTCDELAEVVVDAVEPDGGEAAVAKAVRSIIERVYGIRVALEPERDVVRFRMFELAEAA